MINPHAATADVAEATGPTAVDRNAIRALIGSALGYAMDGFDLLILGFMLRSITADLSLSPAQGASLVTATLIAYRAATRARTSLPHPARPLKLQRQSITASKR